MIDAIKWIASIIIIIAVILRASGDEYHMYDLIFSFTGTGLWLLVSFAWKDKALILLNAVMSFTLLSGLVKDYIL